MKNNYLIAEDSMILGIEPTEDGKFVEIEVRSINEMNHLSDPITTLRINKDLLVRTLEERGIAAPHISWAMDAHPYLPELYLKVELEALQRIIRGLQAQEQRLAAEYSRRHPGVLALALTSGVLER